LTSLDVDRVVQTRSLRNRDPVERTSRQIVSGSALAGSVFAPFVSVVVTLWAAAVAGVVWPVAASVEI